MILLMIKRWRLNLVAICISYHSKKILVKSQSENDKNVNEREIASRIRMCSEINGERDLNNQITLRRKQPGLLWYLSFKYYNRT